MHHRLPAFALVLLLWVAVAALACSEDDAPVATPAMISTPPEVASTAVTPARLLEPGPTATPEPRPGLLAGRRICIDPGHDDYWVPGAAGRDRAGRLPRHAGGFGLNEHELTLAVASRLQMLLEAEGAATCVTRKPAIEGGGLQSAPVDFNGDGRVRTRGQAVEDEPERIQPRIDYANAFGADVLLSVHFNGLDDRTAYGTEVYFTDGGPRPDDGRRLGAAVLAGLLAEMRAAGFPALDRGLKSDAYQRYSPSETARLFAANTAMIRANGFDPANCHACYRLLTLGANPMSVRPGAYTGVLVEVEFLSNPDVVEGFLLRPDSLDIIARGLARGLLAYFNRF